MLTIFKSARSGLQLDRARPWPPRHYLGKSYDDLDAAHECPPPPIVPHPRVPREKHFGIGPIVGVIVVGLCGLLGAILIVALATQAAS